MSRPKTFRNAFTLVELVVVIMILGILAGVAAPKFLKTSAEANDNALRHSLTIIRDAVEIYTAQNGGTLPPCDANGVDFRAALAPFLRGTFPASPAGPAAGDARVAPVTGAATVGEATPTHGWKFNTDDGTFIINFDGATACDAAVNYDDL